MLNQPAGHLEQGESLLAAATREALEETGHRFEPEHVVGFYLWRSEDADTTYLRVAFCGTVEPSADVAAARRRHRRGALALARAAQRRAHQLRSPMVLRCIDDYLAGQRYPLDCLTYLEHRAADIDVDATSAERVHLGPAAKMPACLRSSLTVVALSGGVDSAVAALLLRDAGHTVQCLHMSNWEDDGYCDNAREFQDARRVCLELGLPLHRVNFAREYREQVFADFLAEYRAGRTPNPDVLCNRQIKFGVMRRYAQRLGATQDRDGPLRARRRRSTAYRGCARASTPPRTRATSCTPSPPTTSSTC